MTQTVPPAHQSKLKPKVIPAQVNYYHAFLSHLTLLMLSEGYVVKSIDVDGHEKYQFEATIEDEVYRILNVKMVLK